MCVSLAELGTTRCSSIISTGRHSQTVENMRWMRVTIAPAHLTVIPDDPWEWAIVSAGSSLAHNPKADTNRIGVVGFSMGCWR
jgi:hypothetical protein